MFPAGTTGAVLIDFAVNVANETQDNIRGASPCYSGVRIDADNNIYTRSNTGVWSVSQSGWVTGSGKSPADVWVERTIDSGSFTNDGIGATRIQCNVDHEVTNTDTDSGASAEAGVMTVSFYDASSGGTLLDTAVFDISANYDLS